MKKTIIICAVAIMGFYSCDKRTTFEKTITNISDYDIVLYSSEFYLTIEGFPSPNDSLVIASGTTKLVYIESKFGKVDNYSDCQGTSYPSLIDSVKIIASTPKILNFDINTSQKWIFNVVDEDFQGKGNCNCELSIINSDIQ